ncbi:MAG: DsrE/DsrF/DrsH-like family protein [Actinomycetes bacterium]
MSEQTQQKMAIVLFSGTADKLQAAVTIISGAAAMGVSTHVFLTFWGLAAFRRDMAGVPAPMSPEYGELGVQMGKLMQTKGVPAWRDVLDMAIDVGEVHVHACAMTADLLELGKDDLDPVVEDLIGVGSFVEMTRDAQTFFI